MKIIMNYVLTKTKYFGSSVFRQKPVIDETVP